MCVQKDYDEVMEQLVRGIHTREIIYKEEGSEAFDLFILVSRGSAAYPLGKVFSIILSTNYRYIFLVNIVKQVTVVQKKYVDGAKDEIKHPRDWPKIYAYVLVIGADGENGTWKFYRNEKD